MNALLNMIKKLLRRDEASCARVRRMASEFLEDSLPPKRRSLIQDHLKNCGLCRAFVETLATTIGVLTRLPQVAPPVSLKSSILERTRQDDRRRLG